MYKKSLLTIGALALVTAQLGAQQNQRRANIMGGGTADSGKCTIEVVVDGVAEIEINGENAVMRNVSGQPPQWRRFECSSRIPANPVSFRFQGIDGRGRQDLIRDPRNGGAVVRIEDPDGGQEGYTFDLMWGGGPGAFTDNRGGFDNRGPGFDGRAQGRPQFDDRGQGRPPFDDRGQGRPPFSGQVGGGRFATADAIRTCREEIQQRIAQQYGTNVNFQNMRIDDNPGRNDWVLGSFSTPRDRGRLHQFACSVNFDTGMVRSAQIDPPGGRFNYGNADRMYSPQVAIQNCQQEVTNRMRQRGLRNVQFGKIDVDNNPGRNDYVQGSVFARGRMNDNYYFSCSVNLSNGMIRDVEIVRP